MPNNVCHLLCLYHKKGWQLGIQYGAADWDEDWDKFEDEGTQENKIVNT